MRRYYRIFAQLLCVRQVNINQNVFGTRNFGCTYTYSPNPMQCFINETPLCVLAYLKKRIFKTQFFRWLILSASPSVVCLLSFSLPISVSPSLHPQAVYQGSMLMTVDR